MSNKTFQYRIYPTKKQETTLLTWLKLLCETYNAALQERRDAYRLAGKSTGFSQQCAELPACREVRNLIKNPKLAKSIADAAWSQFFEFLQSKAEEAGREVIRVNPAYTSQTCSCCGHRQEMPHAAPDLRMPYLWAGHRPGPQRQ